MTPPNAPTLKYDPEWEVHPSAVKTALDNKEDVLILDVRRQDEWNTVHLPTAMLIPLDQIPSQTLTLEPWKNRRIVVHCHHGVRSLNATKILRQQGFRNVYSLAGGIDAWSLLVDPSVRRY